MMNCVCLLVFDSTGCITYAALNGLKLKTHWDSVLILFHSDSNLYDDNTASVFCAAPI